jgi:hypothetical protein
MFRKSKGTRVQQQQRNNETMTLIVEEGIAQDHLHGSVVAWRFMAANDVPQAVMLRVLSDPSRRRPAVVSVAQQN